MGRQTRDPNTVEVRAEEQNEENEIV